ncbi:MAG: glycosyltransferase [Lachnospiraceae bacterium]|nr:glycosyltransferase [Lachnospiraceae bacterium]
MENKKLLSVVVPCYNEEETVSLFYEELMKVIPFFEQKGIETELLYIDDGSKDDTVAEVRKLHEKDGRVHMVSFSRNFGKEAAMYAGLNESKGDYVVIMDADLQDPPSLLPDMFTGLEEGYDSVATRRVSRKGEPPIRSFFARKFYKIMRKISQTDMMDGARDYRLMTRQMVDAILSMGEYNRFTKGIFGWVGFNTKWLEYENVERAAGKTKWNFWGLVKYSIEGMTAFSTAPLVFSAFVGVLFFFITFIALIFIIVRRLVFGDPVAGWASMVCIIIFISGVQFFCTGILGQYLAKTYMEVKGRPIYLKNNKNCF